MPVYPPVSVTVLNTPTLLMAASLSRETAMLTNGGAEPLTYGFGPNITAGGGSGQIAPGQSLPILTWSSPLWGVVATGPLAAACQDTGLPHV